MQKKRGWEEQAEAKTAKNRAKRQKKKERAKAGGGKSNGGDGQAKDGKADVPLKKRRLVNGKEMVFRRPGEEGSDDEGGGREESPGPRPELPNAVTDDADAEQAAPADTTKVVIHEDD